MYYICIIRRKRRNECYDATYSYILNRIYYRKKKQKNKIGQSDCKPEDFSFIRCKILKYKISLSNDYIIESFDFILSSPVFPHRNENVCYLFFSPGYPLWIFPVRPVEHFRHKHVEL